MTKYNKTHYNQCCCLHWTRAAESDVTKYNNHVEAIRKHLRDLFTSGVIRELQSPFSSPIVVVRKKNGDVRLCIDYRKLNLQTVKDAYALPNLKETFSALWIRI